MKTAYSAIIAGAAFLFVTGCTTTPPKSTARTVHFACDNGPPLTVVFDSGTAVVTPEGSEAISLPQSPSADGFLYMTPQHSLRGKGDEVIWTVGRMVPIKCKVQG